MKKIDDNSIKVATGGLKDRPPGLICPQCEGVIPVTMQQIICESFITCPHCGFQIKLNPESPAIQDLQEALNKLKM